MSSPSVKRLREEGQLENLKNPNILGYEDEMKVKGKWEEPKKEKKKKVSKKKK